MKDTLSPRQKDTHQAIVAFWATHGYGPSIRELGIALGGINNNAVVCHLRALKKKGAILWDPVKARSIRAVSAATTPEQDGPRACRVPDGILVSVPHRPLSATEARTLAIALAVLADHHQDDYSGEDDDD